MSEPFETWREAHEEAERRASTGVDVAIRRGVEFGRVVFRVSYACRTDSDYSLAEIVRGYRNPSECEAALLEGVERAREDLSRFYARRLAGLKGKL